MDSLFDMQDIFWDICFLWLVVFIFTSFEWSHFNERKRKKKKSVYSIHFNLILIIFKASFYIIFDFNFNSVIYHVCYCRYTSCLVYAFEIEYDYHDERLADFNSVIC